MAEVWEKAVRLRTFRIAAAIAETGFSWGWKLEDMARVETPEDPGEDWILREGDASKKLWVKDCVADNGKTGRIQAIIKQGPVYTRPIAWVEGVVRYVPLTWLRRP